MFILVLLLGGVMGEHEVSHATEQIAREHGVILVKLDRAMETQADAGHDQISTVRKRDNSRVGGKIVS